MVDGAVREVVSVEDAVPARGLGREAMAGSCVKMRSIKHQSKGHTHASHFFCASCCCDADRCTPPSTCVASFFVALEEADDEGVGVGLLALGGLDAAKSDMRSVVSFRATVQMGKRRGSSPNRAGELHTVLSSICETL